MDTFVSDFKIKYQGQDIDIDVLSYSPGIPAKTSGPPENCYPEEYPEVEFEIQTGNDLLDQLLMENHEDEITKLVFQGMAQQKYEAEMEAASQKYDEMNDRRYGL